MLRAMCQAVVDADEARRRGRDGVSVSAQFTAQRDLAEVLGTTFRTRQAARRLVGTARTILAAINAERGISAADHVTESQPA